MCCNLSLTPFIQAQAYLEMSLRLTPQELNKGGEEFSGEDSG